MRLRQFAESQHYSLHAFETSLPSLFSALRLLSFWHRLPALRSPGKLLSLQRGLSLPRRVTLAE
jgi:hypothetical protein